MDGTLITLDLASMSLWTREEVGAVPYILTMPKFATPQSTSTPPAAFGPLPVPTGKGERLTGAS